MAPPIDSLERELKLTTELDFELPDLGAAVGRTTRLPEQELCTAYFDTPDLRLWEMGITLRHRQGDKPHVGTWTLKLPSTGKTEATLDRTELSWPGDPEAIPSEAMATILGIVRHSVVHKVAELSTERRRLVLHDRYGISRGELDDDTVTVLSGRQDGLRFRQIELEIEPGADEWAGAVLKQLRHAGARLENLPKLAKALELPSRRRKGRTQTLTRRSRIGDVVEASIGAGLRHLLDHDYRLRLSPLDPDPHDVHQARVATRRLRSDLKTFAPVLDPLWLRHTRAELKRIGEALGSVRDTDVLIANLVGGEELPAGSKGLEDLRQQLDDQRRLTSRALAEIMKGERYLSLLDRLHAAAGKPPFYGDEPPSRRAERLAPRLVRRQWRQLRRRVRKANRHPSSTELHKVRIAAKQLRYAAEATAPVVGRPARRTAKAAEHLQTVLGEYHDSVEAERWLVRRELGRSPEAKFAAGWLAAEQQLRQRKLRREWRSVWGRLDRKKITRWFG